MKKLKILNLPQSKDLAITAVVKATMEIREQKPETEIKLVFFEAAQPRTLPQNNYYKGIVLADMSNETGYEVHECDMILKDMFGVVESTELNGRVITQHKSTARYTKHEMSEFLDKVIRWAASVGISIRDPKAALTMEQYMELVEQGYIKLK